MDGLYQEGRFAGFGPNRFDPLAEPNSVQFIQGRTTQALRGCIRRQLPRRPGIYAMLDPAGRLIYVGKAKCLRGRLLSYFRPKSRDPKAGRILSHTRTLVWEPAPSEFAALLRELDLIQTHRPLYNVQGQPGHHRAVYMVLGRRPAPYLFLSRQPPRQAIAIYGPLRGRRALAEAVRRVNDWFRLRDCAQSQPIHFADQPELFPLLVPDGCLRHEIKTCCGPCAGHVSRQSYSRHVRAARAFLDGSAVQPLKDLERDMRAAAMAQEYERAAGLRDKLESLQGLQDRLAWLQRARIEHSFVYPVVGIDGSVLWYLIHRGRAQAVVPQPHNGPTARAAREVIETIYPSRATAMLVNEDRLDTILLVAGWFRRYPEERCRVLAPAAALARCKECRMSRSA